MPSEYTPDQAAKMRGIFDDALKKAGVRKPRPLSADALAAQLGNALERWPDDFGPGERDEVSHIIDVLDRIAEAGR